LVVAALVVGLVVYEGGRAKPKPSAADAVLKEYLAYSAATTQVSRQMSLDPIRPYLTDAGLIQATSILQHAIRTGSRYEVTLEHRPQVVVYSPGDLASVDDVVGRKTTPLDAAAQTPAGTESSDFVHQSAVLRKEPRGGWLVDSVALFGTDSPEGSLPISYAAAAKGAAVATEVRGPIESAYRNYWDSYAKAVMTLDATPLGRLKRIRFSAGIAPSSLKRQRSIRPIKCR